MGISSARTFIMPFSCFAKAKTKFKDGVLEMRIAKAETTRNKEIKIKIE
jgi:HSP20 family molecular chaperone IbpA